MILRGIRREKGDQKRVKLPITPDLLLKIRTTLNLQNPQEALFWAACLVAFFGLLRKSNLLPPSVGAFHPDKHLSRNNLTRCHQGLTLSVSWSKTIQYKERKFMIPLPLLKDHPLCPVIALVSALSLDPNTCTSRIGPLFHACGITVTQPVFCGYVAALFGCSGCKQCCVQQP